MGPRIERIRLPIQAEAPNGKRSGVIFDAANQPVKEPTFQERHAQFANKYPFFKRHVEAVREFLGKAKATNRTQDAYLAYSLWLDYPDAQAGIATLTGMKVTDVKRSIVWAENLPEEKTARLADISERLSEEDDAHYSRENGVDIHGVNGEIDDEASALAEHVTDLRRKGHNSSGIVLETLFANGFELHLTQNQYAKILGVKRQRVKQICDELKSEGFPVPDSFGAPRKKERELYDLDLEWMRTLFGMSNDDIKSNLSVLRSRFPMHFKPDADRNNWRATAQGLNIVVGRFAQDVIPFGFSPVTAKLEKRLSASGPAIHRALRSLSKQYPEDYRGGSRKGIKWQANQNGREKLVLEVRRLRGSGGFSPINTSELAKRFGTTERTVKYKIIEEAEASAAFRLGNSWQATSEGLKLLEARLEREFGGNEGFFRTPIKSLEDKYGLSMRTLLKYMNPLKERYPDDFRVQPKKAWYITERGLQLIDELFSGTS